MDEEETLNLYSIALKFKSQEDIYNYVVHMIMAANNNHSLAISHIKGEVFMDRFYDIKNNNDKQIYNFLTSTREKSYSMAFLGCYYIYKNKPKRAIKYFKESINNPVSLLGMAVYYQLENSYPHDLNKAIDYFNLAVEQNFILAMILLGKLYSDGKSGVQNYGKAKELFETAIELGSISAISLLANLYCYGKGVPKDFKKAKELTQMAVDKGDVNALVVLGLMWQEGTGGEKDIKEARKLFEAALEKNHPTALNRILILYRDTDLKNDRAYVIDYFNKINKLDRVKLIYKYDDWVIDLIKENLEMKNRIKGLENDNSEMQDHIMASPEGSLFFEAREDWKRRSCKF